MELAIVILSIALAAVIVVALVLRSRLGWQVTEAAEQKDRAECEYELLCESREREGDLRNKNTELARITDPLRSENGTLTTRNAELSDQLKTATDELAAIKAKPLPTFAKFPKARKARK